MLWDSTAALCGAGRGAGTRATDGRLFTGRRRTGRATGLGTTGFFLSAVLRMAGFFALAALPATLDVGRLPLPPFFDLPLAMLAVPLPADLPPRARHFHTKGRVYSSLISSSFSSAAKKILASATWRANSAGGWARAAACSRRARWS